MHARNASSRARLAMPNIGHRRLSSQQIGQPTFRDPAQVVASLGAVQAQDYPASVWAIGLRSRGAVEADVAAAVAKRAIVRTWPMRGTLHFVAAEDVRWMLALLAPRVVAGAAGRHRQLGLDEASFTRSRKLLVRALQGGRQLTRPELYAILERGGVSPAGQRGIHVLGRFAQEGLICFGPHRDKQPTFTLLEEWVPAAKHKDREESLAMLAERYFTGHGPAMLSDFVWWSGLKVADAKIAIALAAPRLAAEQAGGDTYWMSSGASEANGDPAAVHLLPAFDEYLVGYRDRSAVLTATHTRKITPYSNGMFSPIIVIGGAVVGTWSREARKGTLVVTAKPFRRLRNDEQRGLAAAAERYGRFLKTRIVLAAP